MNELENCRLNPKYKLDADKWYTDIVSYMEWCESLASMVNNKVLSLNKIDDMLSYRFFIIVNNKTIQKKELIPNKEFYRGVYKLYDKWYKYKIKQNLEVILEKNDLSKTPGYYDIIK